MQTILKNKYDLTEYYATKNEEQRVTTSHKSWRISGRLRAPNQEVQNLVPSSSKVLQQDL